MAVIAKADQHQEQQQQQNQQQKAVAAGWAGRYAVLEVRLALGQTLAPPPPPHAAPATPATLAPSFTPLPCTTARSPVPRLAWPLPT